MTYYDGQCHLDEDDIEQIIADWCGVSSKNVDLYFDENCLSICADVKHNKEIQ